MKKTILTRADLTQAIYREIGLSRVESQDLVESVITHIVNTLLTGETVKLSGFGTFSIHKKQQRMGRNPKTGEEAVIDERLVLRFRPSPILRTRMEEIPSA